MSVRFQVLMATSMHVTVFWDVAVYSLVETDRRFRGHLCRLCLYCDRSRSWKRPPSKQHGRLAADQRVLRSMQCSAQRPTIWIQSNVSNSVNCIQQSQATSRCYRNEAADDDSLEIKTSAHHMPLRACAVRGWLGKLKNGETPNYFTKHYQSGQSKEDVVSDIHSAWENDKCVPNTSRKSWMGDTTWKT
jgi:hypothetical protein